MPNAFSDQNINEVTVSFRKLNIDGKSQHSVIVDFYITDKMNDWRNRGLVEFYMDFFEDETYDQIEARALAMANDFIKHMATLEMSKTIEPSFNVN